jgi:hypothetical protein
MNFTASQLFSTGFFLAMGWFAAREVYMWFIAFLNLLVSPIEEEEE